MFKVNPDKSIVLHRGDTGEITIKLKGYDFDNVNAKALFTLRSGSETVKEEVCDIVGNQFVITFRNEDTDYLTPGSGEYDVRVAIDPVFDAAGKLVSGVVVRTTTDPIPVTIKRTVGVI